MAENLRYPNEQIDESTDYLSIKVLKYEPGGFNLKGFRASVEKNQNALLDEVPNAESATRKAKQVLANIILPIPSGVTDSNGVSWSEDSINALAAFGAQKFTEVITSGNLSQGLRDILDSVSTTAQEGGTAGIEQARDSANAYLASKAVNLFGANTSPAGILARSSGKVLNPNKELLFNGVKLRQFNFTYNLSPRDEKEAIQVKKIIRCFKQNMAAQKGKDGFRNLFLNSPNVFELQYKTGGEPHKFLNKFKLCALANVVVNYTGSGTYMTYNDDDKTPVHMTMQLSFQELVPILDVDYETEEGKIGVGY